MCLHDFNWITDPFLEGLFSLTLKKTSPKDYPVAIHKVCFLRWLGMSMDAQIAFFVLERDPET